MKPVLARCHPRVADKPYAPDVLFNCPGCKCQHGVWTDKAASNGARWSWNGDLVRPTFSPSLLIEYVEELSEEEALAVLSAGGKVEPRRSICHSFITDGRIQFLGDCTHALAGRTVDLAPVE